MLRGGGHGYAEQERPPWTRQRGHDEEEAPPCSPPFRPSLPVVPAAPEQQPAESLPADLVAEMILPRVPYRSLCRFKCVSKSWRVLCSDTRIRRRSPQTLSGFFCYSFDQSRDIWHYASMSVYFREEDHPLRFVNLSGRGRPLVDPSLSFLRKCYAGVRLVDCCGGLLCCCWKSHPSDAEYVVCNPATEETWAVLPATEALKPTNVICLGFDPDIPSRFTVFVLVQQAVEDDDWATALVVGVDIYPSETGRWTRMESQWDQETETMVVDNEDGSSHVFFNGALHWTTLNDCTVVSVDCEGKVWRKTRVPCWGVLLGHSQGRLYAMHCNAEGGQLSIWVFEDHADEPWALKHTANI